MNLYSNSLINLALALSLWLGFILSCSSIQPPDDKQAGDQIGNYQRSQLGYCGENLRAGYLIRGGERIPFESDEPNFAYQGQTPTPEEKARGVVWKYECWFAPKRYRILQGGRWSEWMTPSPGEKMGRATFTLEAGKWIVRPASDEFTRADCADFKKIPG